ncbi:MAG: 16S rRNA (adenine(1518)-N(6)/adenine(1519)-N(6))-dimethyltransferase RsmA [Candidatus Bathyarchaeota archaeon]
MHLSELVKRCLREHNLYPRKSFSQNFMVDEQILQRMADYADLKETDKVMEIGAGLGFLTKILAKNATEVIAIELDRNLVKILNRELGSNKKIKIVQGDFLKVKINGYNKVVSNPPYSKISQIVFKILSEKFDLGVLTLQKDFAKRLVAQAGTKDYGRLTVMAYVRAKFEFMEDVPATAFYPSPDVSSAILRIKPRKKMPVKILDWNIFDDTVRLLFTQRKRILKKAFRIFTKKGWRENGVKDFVQRVPSAFLERRVFTLTPSEFGAISNAIFEERVNYQY